MEILEIIHFFIESSREDAIVENLILYFLKSLQKATNRKIFLPFMIFNLCSDSTQVKVDCVRYK